MKKGMVSFNAQVGITTILRCKIKAILSFLFLFFINFFLAQTSTESTPPAAEPLISVVGDAAIYSKDAAFNEQIRNNKNLQLHSKIEIDPNSALKITAKHSDKKTKIATSPPKKRENIVVSSKKENKFKSDNFPKKEVFIKINYTDISNKFLLGSSSGKISFVPPTNDSFTSKYFSGYHLFEERLSVKFPNVVNYYYKNRNLKKRISLDKFSVRPPPNLIF